MARVSPARKSKKHGLHYAPVGTTDFSPVTTSLDGFDLTILPGYTGPLLAATETITVTEPGNGGWPSSSSPLTPVCPTSTPYPTQAHPHSGAIDVPGGFCFNATNSPCGDNPYHPISDTDYQDLNLLLCDTSDPMLEPPPRSIARFLGQSSTGLPVFFQAPSTLLGTSVLNIGTTPTFAVPTL